MGFLIRIGFWLSLVLLAIPMTTRGDENGDRVGPLQAVTAAGAAIGDIAGLCERKPDVCETGKAAFATISVRARDSAEFAYRMLDAEFGEQARSVSQDHDTSTGSIAPAPAPMSETVSVVPTPKPSLPLR